ncbi:MAG: hypothetical protein ACR2FH_02635 [Caulobacteraceae bacterium]
MRLPPSLFALAAALALCACQKQLEAPTETGACWHLAEFPDGRMKFNRLADHQPDLEHCAAQLEMMRLRFRALGSAQTRMTGAFQGQFLFLQPEGVFTAQSYGGYRYPFMVRTGDGRLAVPGAMPEQK